jgi:hypothetical protein
MLRQHQLETRQEMLGGGRCRCILEIVLMTAFNQTGYPPWGYFHQSGRETFGRDSKASRFDRIPGPKPAGMRQLNALGFG